MSLVVTKVLASHTFADFRGIFNANADDAIIVRGEADTDGDGVPLLRFLTESDESFEILLSDFYSAAQVDALLTDLRASLLSEFESITGGGGGGGSLPVITSPVGDVSFQYGDPVSRTSFSQQCKLSKWPDYFHYRQRASGWLSYNSGTNTISGTAPSGATGSYAVRVRYTDSTSAYIEDVFNILITSDAQVTASELIWAGMLVNIYDDGGVSKMRPAIASDVDFIAHAYVDKTVQIGQAVEPKLDSIKTYIDLVPGTQYFLSPTEPGGIVDAGPEDSGQVWQPIGRAISSNELVLDIDTYTLIS